MLVSRLEEANRKQEEKPLHSDKEKTIENPLHSDKEKTRKSIQTSEVFSYWFDELSSSDVEEILSIQYDKEEENRTQLDVLKLLALVNIHHLSGVASESNYAKSLLSHPKAREALFRRRYEDLYEKPDADDKPIFASWDNV